MLLILAGCAAQAEVGYTVTVEAGEVAREGSVVSFELPEGLAGAHELEDEEGRRVTLQVDERGRAWFVLDALPAGQARTYHLRPAQVAPTAATAQLAAGDVALAAGGQPVARYHVEPEAPPPGVEAIFRRGGYLHPVYTPAGRVVTGDFPAAHRHHHGIWAAWTKTKFDERTPDFWNMGQGTGTVEVVGLDTAWSGPVHGGLRARHRYVDLSAPEPVTALHETWTVRAYAATMQRGRPLHVFDLDLTQEAATEHPLVLPVHRYGGVGFRGPEAWEGPGSTVFLTSEGRDRSDGHATRARWCHVGGLVDGAEVGVAILSHSGNQHAPQPMRIHPTEPFFNFAPMQADAFAIEPGTPYRARYRFVVYDGPPDAALLDRLWADYAEPPAVTVQPAP